MPLDASLLRYVTLCNNAEIPGDRVPFRVAGRQVGWVRPELLAGLPAGLDESGASVPDAAALDVLARALAARGAYRPRGELFDVRAEPDGPVLARLDRGAVPGLGVISQGVHLNGLVRRADGVWMWVARRAMTKPLDPGKLDHLVGGGIPAGLDPVAALHKEAAEEAGIDAALAARAVPVAIIGYAMERPEGLRRDRLHCFDLDLPESFEPRAVDGEVEAFELWPLPRVLEAARRTDGFKFNVNLVLIDLFLRNGLVDPASEEGRELRAALTQRSWG